MGALWISEKVGNGWLKQPSSFSGSVEPVTDPGCLLEITDARGLFQTDPREAAVRFFGVPGDRASDPWRGWSRSVHAWWRLLVPGAAAYAAHGTRPGGFPGSTRGEVDEGGTDTTHHHREAAMNTTDGRAAYIVAEQTGTELPT